MTSRKDNGRISPFFAVINDIMSSATSTCMERSVSGSPDFLNPDILIELTRLR